jgi:ethanolamine utilization cobalamin adenosyltransferase
VDEMEQLAKSLMQCKSFKERQQNLNEALDHLSFQYSHLYIMLFREMKKRETEYNDTNKITKWLSTSKSNSYVKLHEALILLKSNNIIAKETYLFNLRHMLNQTIENGSNIGDAVKICWLIEKSAHLSTIYE